LSNLTYNIVSCLKKGQEVGRGRIRLLLSAVEARKEKLNCLEGIKSDRDVSVKAVRRGEE